MTRIPTVNRDNADTSTTSLLDTVEKQMGMVPNIISAMAQSNAVANAYLSFSGALAGGSLSARLREQIALVVGQANECDYCLAAHTVLGRGAGLSDSETCDARQAQASDSREAAALAFAQKVVQERAVVSDADVQAVMNAGFSPGQVGEIVANVALNIFTNYFNHVAGTEVDFPAA
ncbi:MAG: carboxymuconolactone decarboxylase family protein, partial [Pirellulales bacterium]|nr:carboxymuconolactone decarboxylase family protein [Pirellulales bacterium]